MKKEKELGGKIGGVRERIGKKVADFGIGVLGEE
jgi:hypothetical protein